MQANTRQRATDFVIVGVFFLSIFISGIQLRAEIQGGRSGRVQQNSISVILVMKTFTCHSAYAVRSGGRYLPDFAARRALEITGCFCCLRRSSFLSICT